MSQPVPDWSTFHNNPNAFNVRVGIFYHEPEKQFDVYVLDGIEQPFSKRFNSRKDALTFLNSSDLTLINNIWTLKTRPNVIGI